MKMTLLNGTVCAALLALSAGAAAAPLDPWDGTLPAAGNPLTSQQYQDFTIYSLNYLTNFATQNQTAGSTYYNLITAQSYNVDSSPGKLADKVVIVTGNTGNVNDNTDTCGATGCDNAYAYPSPAATNFSTITSPEPSIAVPGEPAASMWTAEASALRTFLGGSDMIFMFNLNEDNGGDPNTLDGQSLVVAMKVELTDANGAVLNTFYVGANNALMLPQTAAQKWGSDGAPDNALAAITPTLVDGGLNGYYSTDPRWAYVHGAISVDATTGAFLGMGDCNFTQAANCKTINQNLGANEVAFAAFNQQLSDLILDPLSGVAFMNVTALTGGQSNGFEQLFIMAANIPDTCPPTAPECNPTVPEPGTLALGGLALTVMAALRRRKSGAN